MKKLFYLVASASVVMMLCAGAISCSNDDEPWAEDEFSTLAKSKITRSGNPDETRPQVEYIIGGDATFEADVSNCSELSNVRVSLIWEKSLVASVSAKLIIEEPEDLCPHFRICGGYNNNVSLHLHNFMAAVAIQYYVYKYDNNGNCTDTVRHNGIINIDYHCDNNMFYFDFPNS